MNKVRGKWYVYWWNPNTTNAYPEVVATDFETEESGWLWVNTQTQHTRASCDVRYHDTVDEVMLSMERKLTRDFLGSVDSDLLIRCLKLSPEGQAVLDSLAEKIAKDKPKWLKMLQEQEWSTVSDLDYHLYG